MKLGDWYRTNGESDHLLAVEDVLTDEPQTTLEVATSAGLSPGYTRDALEYLHEEHRVQRRKAPVNNPHPEAGRAPLRGGQWRWEWRSPQC